MPQLSPKRLATARAWLERNPTNEPRRLLDVWPDAQRDVEQHRHVDRARRMIVSRIFVPDHTGVPEREVRYSLAPWAVLLARSS